MYSLNRVYNVCVLFVHKHSIEDYNMMLYCFECVQVTEKKPKREQNLSYHFVLGVFVFLVFFFRCCFFHFVCFLFVFCFVMLLGRIRTSITSLQFFFIFVYFNVTRLSDLEKIFLYPISHGSVFPVKLVVSHVPLSVLIAYWLMIVSLFLLVFGKTSQRTKRVFAASPLSKQH